MFDAGITVSVNLLYAGNESVFDAKIDTGSTFCVFQKLHGEILGLEIEDGILTDINTAAGSFRAFGHELTLTVSRHRKCFDGLFCRKRLFRPQCSRQNRLARPRKIRFDRA